MRVSDLPDPIQTVIADILRQGFDVWLIGSRVNPTGKPPKDWDFVVVGNAALLEQLRLETPVPDLDILVVFDGDNFESPWRDASGSLIRWKWASTGPDSVAYQGTKWPNFGDSPRRGIRVTS
jgi:predicted nucleotidyltransferase